MSALILIFICGLIIGVIVTQWFYRKTIVEPLFKTCNELMDLNDALLSLDKSRIKTIFNEN